MTDEYENLLRDVVRRGRFRSIEGALTASLEAYLAGLGALVLDGPDDLILRAKAHGEHRSRRAAEVAALRYLLRP